MIKARIPARRAHRSQAERTADTRAKLIEAAIDRLYQFGYAATSITVVADAAGVSRGAVTHHFPAKTDLMVAILEAVSQADKLQYDAQIDATSALEWMNDLPAMMWKVISQPSGVAVMEIMLASRADPELAERLRLMQTAINDRGRAFIVSRLLEAGVADRPDGHAVYRVLLAAIRGLALESVFMSSREDVDDAIGVLTEAFRHLNPSLPKKT